MTPRRFLSLFAAVTLALTACATTTTAETSTPDTPRAIVVNSGTGSVTVTAADSGISVTAAINSAEDPPWSAETVGNEYVIDDGCDGIEDCEVDLVIEVAGTADVTVNSESGPVTIADMNSSVTVVGAASNVLLNGITGPINIDITSGDVLGARLVSTVASFNTGSGDLDVTLTEVFESLTVTSASGDVKAQVPGGGYDIDATTSDGEVEIDVDDVDGAAAKITMTTGSGDVTIYRR
ncbi:MAG: DUF4097 family beta strand repeat protein [Acidimicrobiia bacterium]|nr:DUF4097 family beta strand repeat protein [Acidimicrobiia bacterium]